MVERLQGSTHVFTGLRTEGHVSFHCAVLLRNDKLRHEGTVRIALFLALLKHVTCTHCTLAGPSAKLCTMSSMRSSGHLKRSTGN